MVMVAYHCFLDNAVFIDVVFLPADEFGDTSLFEGFFKHCDRFYSNLLSNFRCVVLNVQAGQDSTNALFPMVFRVFCEL